MAKPNKNKRERLIIKFKNTCQICGNKFDSGELFLEHMKPKCFGGTNRKENLSIACRECNSKKHKYNSFNYPLSSIMKHKDFLIKLCKYENKNNIFDKKGAIENIEKFIDELNNQVLMLSKIKKEIEEIEETSDFIKIKGDEICDL